MLQDEEDNQKNDGRAMKTCGLICVVIAAGSLMNYGKHLAGGSDVTLILMTAVVGGVAGGIGALIGSLIDRWWDSR